MAPSSKILFFVLLVILYLSFFAQKAEAQNNLETIMEAIAEDLEEETTVLIVEDLEEFAENPLNINAATESELSKLHLLDEIQIKKLLHYLQEFGSAYSIYELNYIDGFNSEIVKKIAPFIRFGEVAQESEKLSESLKYGRHQVLLRGLGTAQQPEGYKVRNDNSIPYEGDRFRYYARYRFQSRDKFSFGITAEKDPGEAFFRRSNKTGFDFYSGHLSVRLNSFAENIVIGDYVVRAGQGLVLWQGYSMAKSLDVLNIVKNNQGTRPYTSVDENAFFRGASTTLSFGDVRLNFFYSSNKVDGNLVLSDSLGLVFSSLQTSGYHRTENEIADEKAIKDISLGAVVTWRFNHLKIGTTLLNQKFDKALIRNNQLYNRFRFGGNENFTGGVDYLFSKGKYQLFGEAALSKSKGKAFVQGAIANLNDRLSISALFRHFDKDYHALRANSFAEGSAVNNETGMYLGAKLLPIKYIRISAYSDFYRSEWVTFTTAGPASGWDVFAQADFIFSQKFEFYVRYKNEEKVQKNIFNERYINGTERNRKTRLHFQLKLNEVLTLKTRVEHVFCNGLENEHGLMVFQDVQYVPQKIPLALSCRLTCFNTKSYNSRIYAYENDLLYTFSIPAYFGKGIRTYFNLKYKITDKLDFWAKVANTSWNDRETISSGHNEIDGKDKTELKMQLRLKF